MSKSLKKLIDINRLREFKNKLVGTGSAYVQTTAVDQTVAGTKTFSKPIVGSVTGSSGSCTGNAATATTATTAKACTGNAATATKLQTTRTINGTGFNGTANITTANWGTARNITITDGTNTSTAVSVNGSADVALTLPATIKANLTGNCSGSSGSCTGNAATATTATTAKACTGNAASANIATKATQDSDGNKITTTYSKNGHTHDDRYYTENEVNNLLNGKANTSGTYSNLTVGNAGSATNATNSNAANQLQAFVNDNFTGGNHYVKAIRSSQGWSTHLWMCYNNGAKMADEVSVNYANSAGGVAWDNVSGKPSAFTPYFANGTWYAVGDDAAIGDHNVGGGLGVKALNSTTTRIDLCYKDDASNYKSITYDGTTLYMNGNCDYATNSGSATKLAAKRTIALSGAATGTATGFDGSGNITIPVTALASSAIRAQWYAAYPDGAEAHNAMWGGRNITAAFNNGTVSANIANGTFKDIFPGDYITKQVTIGGTTYTVNWVIADCDYWINKGDTATTAHHVVIVPQQSIFDANMNNDNVTTGGYFGSRMYMETIQVCAWGIANAFGSDHILTFHDGITNSVDTSHVSSGIPQMTGTPGWWGKWGVLCCNLMSEKMVYGAPICSAGAMDNTMATRQMSAFRLSERLINYNRWSWWLRDVVSSASFADVCGDGSAGAHWASDVRGVRPFALLK